MLLRHDPYHAFLPYPATVQPHSVGGPLAGLDFAVKDLFDVAGYPTSSGNPLILAERGTAKASAAAVTRLLAAGASCVGKTHTDELAWGLFGLNPHFGTPINPASPQRAPGGSSSGSAVAVAAGQVDFALGTDTGGSIRIPASYCGIWGVRPTHGRVSLGGCAALAPSFDTCGWFARDPEVLRRVGEVLLGQAGSGAPLSRRLMAADMLEHAGPMVAGLFDAVAAAAPGVQPATCYAPDVATLRDAFTVLQHREAARALGPWVVKRRPALDPVVAGRFAYAQTLTEADEAAADAVRAVFRGHMDALLGDDGVLIAPVSAAEALPLDSDPAAAAEARRRLIELTCVAGLAGLPQVVFPGLIGPSGAPIGISVIGPRGRDLELIAAAADLAGRLAGADRAA